MPVFDAALRNGRLQEQVARLHDGGPVPGLRDQVEVDVHDSAARSCLPSLNSKSMRPGSVQLAEQEVVRRARDHFLGWGGGKLRTDHRLLRTYRRTLIMIDALANVDVPGSR